MSAFIVLIIIVGGLWIVVQQGEKHSQERSRIAFETSKHLPSFLRECTGVGPWLEMDDFYRNRNVHLKCTSCSRDTIFVSNSNPAHETEFIDVHFAKGRLRVVYGNRSLFDGDPLNLMSYPLEAFPLKEDSPPPKESGSCYSVWVDYFKDNSRLKQQRSAFIDRLPSANVHGGREPPWPVDPKSKLAILLEAATQGDEDAQCKIGDLYCDPTSELFDSFSALPSCRKAAENGNANAQNALAALYSQGIGFPQSDTEAYFWAYLGAKGGRCDWGNRGYTRKLTPTEIAQAEERAEAWIASKVESMTHHDREERSAAFDPGPCIEIDWEYDERR